MPEEALDTMMRHPWPLNLDELRTCAVRLHTLHRAGSIRGAARVLGIKHQSLGAYLERMGVPSRTLH